MHYSWSYNNIRPSIPTAEETLSKSVQCAFESRGGYKRLGALSRGSDRIVLLPDWGLMYIRGR